MGGSKEYARHFVEVKQQSDRLMCVKVEIEGVMMNIVSGFASQVAVSRKRRRSSGKSW